MATANTYNALQVQLWSGKVDFVNDTIVAALLGPSYVPDAYGHDMVSDLIGELSGSGYARVSLTGKSVGDATYASTGVQGANCVINCNPITFASFSGSYRYLVVFKDTGVAATSPLIGYVDYGATRVVSASPVTLAINSSGLLVWAVA